MSAEMVAAPVGVGIAAGILALPLLAPALGIYGVARLVKAHVDQEIEKERQRLAEDRQRLIEWEQRCVRQAAEMKALIATQEALARILSHRGIKLTTSRPDVSITASDEKTKKPAGRTDHLKTEIDRVIEATIVGIESFEKSAGLSGQRMQSDLSEMAKKFRQRLNSGGGIIMEEAESFASTIAYEIDQRREKLTHLLNQRGRMLEEVAALFKDVELLRSLTANDRLKKELSAIMKSLDGFSACANNAPAEKSRLFRLAAQAQEAVKREVTGKAVKTAVKEVVVKHLSEMGYRLVASKKKCEGHFVMKMPGGECLETNIEENGALRFDMRHEAHDSGKQPSAEDIAHFRCQEIRWCREDSKALFAALATEGLYYGIQSEKMAVSMVTVETVDDIEDAEDIRRREEHERILKFKNRPQAKGMHR